MMWRRFNKNRQERSCWIWDFILWINCWWFRVVCLEKGSNTRYLASETEYIYWEKWEGQVDYILVVLSLRCLETSSEWEKYLAKGPGDVIPISEVIEPHQTLHSGSSLCPPVCRTETLTWRPLRRFRHSFLSHINYAEMNIIAVLRVYPKGDEGLFCLICLLLNALQCNVVIEEILSTLSELTYQTSSFPSTQPL